MTGVRWNATEGCFEGRCDGCLDWLEISPETRHDLWPVASHGFRICRACDRLRTNARLFRMRQDPAVRERNRRYSHDYYHSMSAAERRALRRIEDPVKLAKHLADKRRWSREYRERKRAA